ncbi:PmbA/TldA family metallopeptidase, partial [Synechococcus sp. R3-13]|uniref:PmbA/TldA family metallopeptidase n=1 Tax=Synechococcus sp. R3-13 TaxID=2421316 RepID=UPI0039C1C130
MPSSIISPENLLDLCEQGVHKALAAGADQAEVFANSGRETEVTFEKNDLNLARSSSETLFGIRVFCDGRLGFATSNRPEELAETAAEAVTMAKASPADPLNGLPEPQPLPQVPFALDPGLLELDAAELTQLGSQLLEWVRSKDPRITIDSGSLSVEEETLAIASSTGIRANYHSVEAGGSLFGMAIDGDEVGSFAYD